MAKSNLYSNITYNFFNRLAIGGQDYEQASLQEL